MKLLFVGYLHGFGGAEKMLITLANAMAERGHEVSMISAAVNNPQFPISQKINYEFIPDKGKNKITILFNRYQTLRRYIKSTCPDLTIHFWLQSAYMCAFMGKNIASKTIYAERGDPSDKEYQGLLGIVRSISFGKIRAFVFQSNGARDYFDEKIRKRSIVIHNPVFITPNDYPKVEVRDKRIVSVGRLHEQKNQALLIDAAALLSKQFNEYIIEIYGDGELHGKLQKKINDLGLTERVLLKGAFKDVHTRIYNASLFVLTSDYEGMPNALLEAMVLGIPCISTDCKPGGARELIKDGVNGRIVPCGNADELSKAMMSLLSDADRAEEYSEKAQEVYLESNPKIIYKKWEDYFRKLAQNRE